MLNRRRSGLGSLIPGADLASDAPSVMAPISAIAVNPYQPRRTFAPEALEELAESIRRHGILQPLTVRPRDNGYELVAGERRLQASRKAGLTEVPVIVRECTDEEMLALALVENLQREDLNAIESARSYKQLIDEFGLTQNEVAGYVGKSRSAVANTLRLLSLPERIRQSIEEGNISEGHGRALLAADDADRQLALYNETIDRGLSVRALEALVSAPPVPAAPLPVKKAPRPPRDAHLQRLESDLQLRLGTKVRFSAQAAPDHGTIEIEYYSLEDLNRICETLLPRAED